MKGLFLLCILHISITMSYAQGNKKQSFLLIGRIEGVDTGKIFIVNKTGIVDDTSIIKNGVFSFNGKISEPIVSVPKSQAV